MSGPVDMAKYEALARGIAEGLTIRAAGRRAGYSSESYPMELARRAWCVRRVAFLRRLRELSAEQLMAAIMAATRPVGGETAAEWLERWGPED